MQSDRIENLEELLGPRIGKAKRIVDSKISRLTAPGDNYGGVLLKVDVTLESAGGKREKLYLVAKCIPSNEFLRQIFDIQFTVKKEIAFYHTIVPQLQQFQRDQGVENVIDLFAKLYAARINLNGSDVVDEHSVILMENLVQSGYINLDRNVGFDRATSETILKGLATFHAVPLALRLLRPEVFESKVRPHLLQSKLPPPSPEDKPEENPQLSLLKFLESCEELRSQMPELKEIFSNHPFDYDPKPLRPFHTLIHGDLWGNNILIKFEDGKPVASKFVDFQNMSVRSLVADLLLLLWTSVQRPILEQNLDDLIKFYHDNLVEQLRQLGCDLIPYTFDKFLEELETEARLALAQALFMTTFVIFGKKDGFMAQSETAKPNFGSIEDVTREAKERVLLVIKTCNEKGWL